MRNKKVMTKVLGLILVLSMIMPFALPMTSVSAASAYDVIYATSFDKTESVNGANNRAWEILSNRIGSIYNPGYLVFKNVDFGAVSPAAVSATAGAREGYATAVEIRIDKPDGPLVATVPFEVITFQDPSTGTQPVLIPITGVHDVYITPNKTTMNFYNFQFFAPEEPRLSYKAYTEGGIFEGIEDVDLAREVDLLWQLGMLSGESGDKFDKDMPVSRAEFAKSIYGIYTDIRAAEEAAKDPLAPEKKPIDTGFYDVAGDSEYAEAIAYLSQNGIMNGVGDGLFQPDYYIEKMDAITVLIRAIGYQKMAEEAGGYPNGYLKVATKNKIIPATYDINDIIRYGDLVDLFIGALDTDYLVPEAIRADYIKYTSIGSVLADTRSLYKGEGKVTATTISTLALPKSGLKQNEVQINGETYLIGSTNAASLLGVECDYYYEDKGGAKTLYAIVPSAYTEITFITSMDDEIRNITNSKIIYTPAGEDEEIELEIESDAAILYNGVSAEKKISEIVDYPKTFTGFITVIENGDDSQTILIEEYQDVIIESIDDDKTGVVAHKTTDLANKHRIDWEEDSVLIIEDLFGEEIEVRNIAPGELYTAFVSKNATGKKFVRMYNAQSELVGVVDKIEDGKIYINGTHYRMSNTVTPPTIGQEAKFLINMYGEVVKVEKADIDTWKTGLYLGRTDQNDGFDKTIEIKLMKTDGTIEKFTLNDSVTIDAVKETDYDTICAKLDTITKKVITEGDSIGEEYTNDISAILYRLSGEGKIAGIDIATTDTSAKAEYGNSLLELWKDDNGVWEDADKDVIHWHRSLLTVTEWSPDGKQQMRWYMPKEAQAFAFYGDDREAGCATGTAYNVIGGSNWKVWGTLYSTQGDKRVADLVVWNRNTMIGFSASPVFVYKGSAQGVDADGDPITIIKGWSGGADVEYKLDLNEKVPVFGGDLDSIVEKINLLQPGDVAQIRAYSNNYINRYMKTKCLNDGAQSRDTLSPTHYIGKENDTQTLTNEKFVLGKVIEREKNYFVIQHSDGMQQVLPFGGAVCSVDKRDDGTVIVSSSKVENIEVGDWTFAFLDEGVMSTIVVYKHWN